MGIARKKSRELKIQRGSGILLHLTSLPGPYGIGDLGRSAFEFIDFLARARQRFWQFLPAGPTNSDLDNSPYMSLSAFAGNPLLINPELLVEAGLISAADLPAKPHFSPNLVDYEAVAAYKFQVFELIFASFASRDALWSPVEAFAQFCAAEKNWLDDYALFMSIGEQHGRQPWYRWPRDIAACEKNTVAARRQELGNRTQFYKFLQFCFFAQWQQMHEYARQRGISLIGDIPFYVGPDSADVWANQALFKLDPGTCLPTEVAGVPPDYFSDTGQHWGNPVYRWKLAGGLPNQKLHAWWQKRFAHIFRMAELVRLDHFRGFEASWQIPAQEPTAVNGRWVKGPGKMFFKKNLPSDTALPIIAEDLGFITAAVEKLRDDLGLPGMKVLQFAFDSDANNPHLPHNFSSPNCLVYTGTHDNNTTLGWYRGGRIGQASRDRLRRYVNNHDDRKINWDLIRLAYSSIAKLAIIPLQDVLGLGSDCRMNVPSTSKGNWRWRCPADFLNEAVSQRLAAETLFYGRAG